MKPDEVRFVRIRRALINRYWTARPAWESVVAAALDPKVDGVDVFAPDDTFVEFNYEKPTRALFPALEQEELDRRVERHRNHYGYAFLHAGEYPLGPTRTFLYKQNWT